MHDFSLLRMNCAERGEKKLKLKIVIKIHKSPELSNKAVSDGNIFRLMMMMKMTSMHIEPPPE